MRTKNIFKTVALAMLMPAMLLTTACSNDDDLVNNEPTVNKGYALPVTVSATRQGDATTRATFDGSKLNFSAGDQLFVRGSHTSAGSFAGTLTWQSGGTFSGTINTENEYKGTADAFFADASSALAFLLPDGYETTGFLSINENSLSLNPTKAFVASGTAKATAVEQFSLEEATTYSSGFTLAPMCAILNFTITGLTTGVKDVALKANPPYPYDDYTVTGSVTPNASGVATFAIGVLGSSNIKDMENNLTVGSSNFTLPSSTTFTAGKIYNITRGTGATVDLSTINAAYTAQNGETLTGTLASEVQISIADGATVILNGVTISNGQIICSGNANIILMGANTVTAPNDKAAIKICEDQNTTLTITGSGSLTAQGGGGSAGIGTNFSNSSAVTGGKIVINGGTVIATGGYDGAGIGTGMAYQSSNTCGDITINGGTVTATGGKDGAAIGTGLAGQSSNTCGNITIGAGVTSVTATKGNNSPNSIGKGRIAYGTQTCGTITIGGTVYWDGSAYQNGGDTYLVNNITYPTAP